MAIAFLALVLLTQFAVYLGALAFFALRVPAGRTIDEIEQQISELGIPQDGAERVRRIREDPDVFAKVKAAARLRVTADEPQGVERFLARSGFWSVESRTLFALQATIWIFFGTSIGSFLAVGFGAISIADILSGANLGTLFGALSSVGNFYLRARAARTEVARALPAFAQQVIAIIVGGSDIETGLRRLGRIYEARGARNRLIDVIHEVNAATKSGGSLLSALRARAALLGEDNLRKLLSSLARGAEHGTSIVKELQDLARVATESKPGFDALAYTQQPLERALELADLPISAGLFRGLQFLGAILGMSAAWYFKLDVVMSTVLIAGFGLWPYAVVLSKISERKRAFDSEFVYYVGQLTSALSSGDDTLTALRKVNDYFPENALIRFEAEQVLMRVSNGESEEQATIDFARNIPSAGADQLAVALTLSRMVPGKLYNMLQQAVVLVKQTQGE